ncbi:MAG: hypothetical protein C0605_01260 [Hyphomicrobiales bacterium]|nr:MAG: hypothetical protein C0605_01260 [Hyphomicrobiales bacterium]
MKSGANQSIVSEQLVSKLLDSYANWSIAVLILTLIAYSLVIVWGARKLGLVLNNTKTLTYRADEGAEGAVEKITVSGMHTPWPKVTSPAIHLKSLR